MTPTPTPLEQLADELGTIAGSSITEADILQRAEAASRLAASPSSGAVREALELAYGLLWVVGCDRATLGGNALYLARKALLEQLDKAGQGRGITAARKVLNDEDAASGARYRVCCPADFYTLPRTDSGTSDASIGGGASGSLASLRDDGDSEGAASADGLTSTIDAAVSPPLREGTYYLTRGNKNNLRQLIGPLQASGDSEFPWRSDVYGSVHRWRDDGVSAESSVRDIVGDPVYAWPAAALAQTEGGKAQPGMNWELSEECKKHLAEIDDNSRHAMANIGNLIIGAPSEATPAPAKEVRTSMTEDQIKYMVNRFLGWTLPENFNPDGGVSFKRLENRHHHPEAPPFYPMPTGTNLFDATQATGMVRHMLTDMPVALSTTPADATYKVGRWLSAALDDPAVCAEMKADINAWFAAGQPNAQPDPADDAAVAWQWRTRPEDNWTFSVSRLSLNDIGRTSSAFEERPLFTHPAKAVDVEAIAREIALERTGDEKQARHFLKCGERIAALLTTGNASSETEGGR